MELSSSVILGLVQGLTEFLPVSSSGHLVLMQYFLNSGDVPLLFDIVLHAASLAAVLYFFRARIAQYLKALFKPVMQEERREIFFLCLSTCITGAMAVFLKSPAQHFKAEPRFLIPAFLFTALILLVAERSLKKTSGGPVKTASSVLAGIFQGLALLPGISRSGSTISALVFSGVKGDRAVEYSFMLSIPAIAGALILEFDSSLIKSLGILPLTAGFAASFIASIFSLRLLIFLIRRTALRYFSAYLLVLCAFLSFYFLLLK